MIQHAVMMTTVRMTFVSYDFNTRMTVILSFGTRFPKEILTDMKKKIALVRFERLGK